VIRKNELFYSNFSLSGSSILDGESQNYDIPIISDCTTKSTFLKNITNKYKLLRRKSLLSQSLYNP